MLSDLISRAPQGPIASWLSSRGRRFVIAAAAGLCYVLSAILNVLEWQSGSPWSTASQVLDNLIIITGFVLVWLLLSHLLRQRQASPLKIFWTTLLVGFLYVLVAGFTVQIAVPSGIEVNAAALGFEYGTGVPLTAATVVKMNVLSLFQAIFSFYILLRFRDLVLFKRTKRSQRNWRLMLALMAFASLSTIFKDPSTEAGWIQFAAAAPAIILATMNAFRVSWIVYLSFKEKAAAIGLTVLLLLILGTLLGSAESLPGLQAYLSHYSYPLEFFTRMAIGFGVLYCVTSFLFLLFHLPTTVDFQRKAGEVTAMHSLTHLVGQVFDTDKLYNTITATTVDAGSGRAAWLAIADPKSGSLRPRIVSAFNTTTSIIEEMVDLTALYEELEATREAIVLDEATADHRIHIRPGEFLGSLLMAPILGRDRMLGGLFVTKDVTHGFEKDDVEAISVYAAQAAIALENARLFEEQVEKERMTRELDIAREVQRKLLPQSLPTLRGMSIAASSVSALEVGGDYYDFLQLDENRLAIIIADVSGKGTSAAFYMAEMQGIFRSVSRLASSPAAFLDHANTALATSLERHLFISVIYGIMDVEKEELVIVRGGHCPAAMINLNGDARFIRSQGLGLGLDRSGLFKQSLVEESIRLQPGDVFVLYTDGVVESRSREGQEYGYERLLSALRENRHEDAPELHRSLLHDLDGFLDHTEYDDDMTLVVLKWHGIAVASREEAEAQSAVRRQAITGRVTEAIQTD
ncbi:MAG: GAF domain-containing SpoIIE family protein phosphatase [Rhodothermales bacterium]